MSNQAAISRRSTLLAATTLLTATALPWASWLTIDSKASAEGRCDKCLLLAVSGHAEG